MNRRKSVYLTRLDLDLNFNVSPANLRKTRRQSMAALALRESKQKRPSAIPRARSDFIKGPKSKGQISTEKIESFDITRSQSRSTTTKQKSSNLKEQSGIQSIKRVETKLPVPTKTPKTGSNALKENSKPVQTNGIITYKKNTSRKPQSGVGNKTNNLLKRLKSSAPDPLSPALRIITPVCKSAKRSNKSMTGTVGKRCSVRIPMMEKYGNKDYEISTDMSSDVNLHTENSYSENGTKIVSSDTKLDTSITENPGSDITTDTCEETMTSTKVEERGQQRGYCALM